MKVAKFMIHLRKVGLSEWDKGVWMKHEKLWKVFF